MGKQLEENPPLTSTFWKAPLCLHLNPLFLIEGWLQQQNEGSVCGFFWSRSPNLGFQWKDLHVWLCRLVHDMSTCVKRPCECLHVSLLLFQAYRVKATKNDGGHMNLSWYSCGCWFLCLLLTKWCKNMTHIKGHLFPLGKDSQTPGYLAYPPDKLLVVHIKQKGTKTRDRVYSIPR